MKHCKKVVFTNIIFGTTKILGQWAQDPSIEVVVVVFNNHISKAVVCIATTNMGISIAFTMPNTS